MKIRIVFLLIVFGLLLMVHSCKSTEASKKAQKIESENKAKERKALKHYEDVVKAHNDRQTSKTKDRMEQTKERSEYYNQNKRRSFFERLFGTRKHKKPKLRKL